MIERPKRAITRFFIPLIDVLILMFCIFLLMPFTTGTENAEVAGPPVVKEEKLPSDVVELQKQLAQLRETARRVQLTKGDQGNRFSVRVLEIDPKTGELFAWQERDRRYVRSQQEAERLIFLHKQASAGKEAYFLILYPREASGFPLTQQIRDYRQWFSGVPYGFDTP